MTFEVLRFLLLRWKGGGFHLGLPQVGNTAG